MLRTFVLIVVATLVTAPTRSAVADEPAVTLVVVVAKDAKVTSLSRADLKRAFSGEATTAGGVRLVPFNLPPSSDERARFDRIILGMAPSAVGRYWVDRKIRGGSGAPRALPSATYVVKVVAKFPGAIGYLPASQVTSGVKVIAIDGDLPGQAGYPLGAR